MLSESLEACVFLGVILSLVIERKPERQPKKGLHLLGCLPFPKASVTGVWCQDRPSSWVGCHVPSHCVVDEMGTPPRSSLGAVLQASAAGVVAASDSQVPPFWRSTLS